MCKFLPHEINKLYYFFSLYGGNNCFWLKEFDRLRLPAYFCNMKTYLLTLLALCSAQLLAQDYSKLSSYVRQLSHEHDVEFVTRGNQPVEPGMVMLVRGDESVLAPYCLTHQGDLHLCHLTIEEALALSVSPKVDRIQASPANIDACLDTLTQIVHVNEVWQGNQLPQAYTGKGVLVGVTDAGIDFTHPAFRDDADGHLRIVRAWDKLDVQEGDVFDADSNFPMGCLLTSAEQILSKGQTVDSKLMTHGTCTGSTAAGSAAGTPYRGVAYESDLYFTTELVRSNLSVVDPAWRKYYTNENMLLSFSNIFAYADSIGQPCVISCSIGGQQDMTDCEIMYQQYLERLLVPGHILVASAGNNGRSTRYMHKDAAEESAGAYIVPNDSLFTINVSTTGPLKLIVYNRTTLDSEIISLDMEIGDTLSASGLKWYAFKEEPYKLDILDGMKVDIYSGYDGFDSTRVGYDIFFTLPADAKYAFFNNCLLQFVGKDVEADIFGQDCDLSAYTDNSAGLVLKGGQEGLGTVLSPGSLPAAITVGATSHRRTYPRADGKTGTYSVSAPRGERAYFSSCGPSLHRDIKPDVMAPGMAVISAMNSKYYEVNGANVEKYVSLKQTFDDGKEYQWRADCGTSFSTPVVAGTIALWLQADPTLTADRIREVFAKTCRQEDSMLTLSSSSPGVWPNNECGYGEIDAYAGLLEILGLLDIPTLSAHQMKHVSVVSVVNGSITLALDETSSVPLKCYVYAVSGQLLASDIVQPGTYEITLQLPAYTGVVAVQVEGMGSTLLRL